MLSHAFSFDKYLCISLHIGHKKEMSVCEEKQILDPDDFFGISDNSPPQEEQEEQECSKCTEEKVHICRSNLVSQYSAHPGDEMNSSVSVTCGQPSEEEVLKSPQIENSFFDYMDVTLAIEAIPSAASPGPDGVPPCILKKPKVNIARMLVIIFKSSIEDGEIPEMLKMAFVTPVHKGGSRSQPV